MLFESIELYVGHLRRLLLASALDDLGEIALTGDRTWDAETAVLMVLAEYKHLTGIVDRGQWVQKMRWVQLHDQLERLYRLAAGDAASASTAGRDKPVIHLHLVAVSPADSERDADGRSGRVEPVGRRRERRQESSLERTPTRDGRVLGREPAGRR